MPSDRVLPYRLEADPYQMPLSSQAGLFLYLELACKLGLPEAVDRHLALSGQQGWLDRQYVLALLLLNLAGGEAVDDLDRLEADAGLTQVFRQAEVSGLTKAQRKALAGRFRKGRQRALPSATRTHEWLERFHDPAQEALREPGRAFVPAATAGLRGLQAVLQDWLAAVQACRPRQTATLDADATLVATGKQEALYCYEGYRAYQPLTVYWAEQELVVLSEFRDGNVPAGWQLKRVLEAALAALPAGVEEVFFRSDSAGYQHEVLACCEARGVGYAVACDVTREFRAAVAEVPEEAWQKLARTDGLPGTHEWAEVVFSPQGDGYAKAGRPRRYLAIREALRQPKLPGLEEAGEGEALLAGRWYRLRGLVSNRWELPGAELVCWLWARCGKSEEAHQILKADLAGGILPSGRFGANAAWWALVVLAFNLKAAMQQMVLGPDWVAKRMKALRLHLIGQPARLVAHGRQLYVRVAAELAAWWTRLRQRIAGLEPVPT